MQLRNSFTIARPADEVYAAFLQVDRIATCMPGSTLLGQPEPGTYQGEVKVKVGPLSVVYTGDFVMISTDDQAHRLQMRAKGREARGGGNAEARIIAQLSEDAGRTLVEIETDLDIRGKVAQFGRGVISEVTDGIMQAFAKNVESMLMQQGSDVVSAATQNGPALSPAGAFSPGVSARVQTAALRPEENQTELPDAAPPVAKPAGAEGLDAWSIIIRPILRRVGPDVAVIALSGVAAWLGGRSGARSAARRRAFEEFNARNRRY